MTGSPLDQFVGQADSMGCHVTNLPSRIWVLGGRCDDKQGAPFRSLRDAFWRTALARGGQVWFRDLKRPEDYPGWLEHSGYDDLLEFERDACYLARSTILFAESPGSHAELGSLAISESIAKRLAVIVQRQFRLGDQQDSFLNLGPIRRTESAGLLCVIDTDIATTLPDHDYAVIVETVDKWLPKQPKEEKFVAHNREHALLLLADLVDILLISTESELLQAANHFGCRLTPEQIKKYLKLLNFIEITSLFEHGSTRYWHIKASDGPWIDYTSSSEIPFDRSRFKVRASDLLNNSSRKEIYKRVRV